MEKFPSVVCLSIVLLLQYVQLATASHAWRQALLKRHLGNAHLQRALLWARSLHQSTARDQCYKNVVIGDEFEETNLKTLPTIFMTAHNNILYTMPEKKQPPIYSVEGNKVSQFKLTAAKGYGESIEHIPGTDRLLVATMLPGELWSVGIDGTGAKKLCDIPDGKMYGMYVEGNMVYGANGDDSVIHTCNMDTGEAGKIKINNPPKSLCRMADGGWAVAGWGDYSVKFYDAAWKETGGLSIYSQGDPERIRCSACGDMLMNTEGDGSLWRIWREGGRVRYRRLKALSRARDYALYWNGKIHKYKYNTSS